MPARENLRIGFSATVSQGDATWMYDEGISYDRYVERHDLGMIVLYKCHVGMIFATFYASCLVKLNANQTILHLLISNSPFPLRQWKGRKKYVRFGYGLLNYSQLPRTGGWTNMGGSLNAKTVLSD